MKHTIVIDIPSGRSVAEAEAAVKRHFDPDWFASWWHISDVQDCATGWGDEREEDAITDEEAREVLRLADKYHDCEDGINWTVLRNWIYHVKEQRKDAK